MNIEIYYSEEDIIEEFQHYIDLYELKITNPRKEKRNKYTAEIKDENGGNIPDNIKTNIISWLEVQENIISFSLSDLPLIFHDIKYEYLGYSSDNEEEKIENISFLFPREDRGDREEKGDREENKKKEIMRENKKREVNKRTKSSRNKKLNSLYISASNVLSQFL
jgi:hypothetical protein